jgi:hypothetical protein
LTRKGLFPVIWLVEAACTLLFLAGITLLVRAPARPKGKTQVAPHDDPRTYIRRTAGMILAAFGLAFGLIVGVFYLS